MDEPEAPGPDRLRRLWTMLAHAQGALLNASRLAGSLGVSVHTVNRYLGVLSDLLLVRKLPPVHANIGKRLVKSPKVYLRDTGFVHALLDLPSFDAVVGHPVVGASWEGFVIENLLAAAPDRTQASFFRTAAGAEMDLVLNFPDGERWAVETKWSRVPRPTKGFHLARVALAPDRCFLVGYRPGPLSGHGRCGSDRSPRAGGRAAWTPRRTVARVRTETERTLGAILRNSASAWQMCRPGCGRPSMASGGAPRTCGDR